ncbi:hypothetical protein [Amycolatopsis sp. cmx-4-68]|uniref:hypothetical protein n=1 Tax=Amycolatopsis sp. cmx-4-68 TaxID=2790938 RepID=UPI0039789871
MSELSDIQAEVQGLASTLAHAGHRMAMDSDNAAVAVGGTGFTLNADQAHAAVREIDGFLEELETMKQKARSLQALAPPARDSASEDYNRRLTLGKASPWLPIDSGAAFDAAVDQVNSEINYLKSMREKLYKALGMTAETDAGNKEKIGQAAEENDRSIA